MSQKRRSESLGVKVGKTNEGRSELEKPERHKVMKMPMAHYYYKLLFPKHINKKDINKFG